MKRIFLLASSIILIFLMGNASAASEGACPDVSQLNYSGGTEGTISPPAGWSVGSNPTSPDNTPSGWSETRWNSYHGSIDIGDHVECFYGVKGYEPNSGEGSWEIIRDQSSSDPWLMEDRPAGWVDQESHKTEDFPWDFCQTDTGGSKDSCKFPTS